MKLVFFLRLIKKEIVLHCKTVFKRSIVFAMRIICFAILSLFWSAILTAQTASVSGIVIDEDSFEALIGATIFEKGTSNGTVADIEGNYQLSVSSADAILTYSYVGYEQQEVEVNGRSKIDIRLVLDIEQLSEIVVIGYGSVRKSDLTGAITSIKSEELTKVVSASPVQALQGKVSGLQVLSTSGDPGAAPVVRLRGITTLNNNNPLFVVDGVIIDNSGNTSLDFVNPNDVASVEVLKDASALAIFGARGSNGVIIITTKRGEKGKQRISVSSEVSLESVANKVGVLSGKEFATLVEELTPGTYSNFDVLPNVDWQDLIFQDNAPIINNSFSVSGASDKVSYYFGLGHYYQQGVIPKSDYERITTRFNTTYTMAKGFDVGLNMSVALKEKQNAPDVVNTALRAWPINEPTDAAGNFQEVRGSSNALAGIAYTNNETRSLETVGNLFLEYDFLDGFTAKSSFQFVLGLAKNTSFTPEFYVAPLQQNETSDLTKVYSNNSQVIWENTLAYSKEFSVHRINALVGYTSQFRRNESLVGTGENLLREDPLFWYIDATSEEAGSRRVSNGASESSMLSALFRINYALMDKYLMTVSVRRDGSSNFGANNRYGVFPSVALGWNLSEEAFFPKNSLVEGLKIRASWGIIGNEKIPGNDQYSTIGVNERGAVFGVEESLNSGASFTSAGNPELRWEETRQTNIGANIDMLQGRLSAETDYYIRTTSDILVNLSPAGYFGVDGDIRFNAATVRNKGLEFNINWQDQIGDFTYGAGVLGSFVSNEVIDLAQNIGADSILTGGDLGNGQRVARTVVGQPIGFFYGYDVIGVFQNEDQLNELPRLSTQRVGDLIYRDANGDGRLNEADRVILGNSLPDFLYGFSANVGYKGFGVSLDFQGQSGVDIYNGKQVVTFSLTNYEDKFLNRWTEESPSNVNPKASQGGVNYQPSNYFIEDGSFLRLRTVTLSYNFSDQIPFGLKLYLRANNLATWTDYSGYSPDIASGSPLDGVIDRGVYPVTRVFSAGMNLTF